MKRFLFGLFVVIGIALLSGCEVPTEFTVDATVDAPDAVPGDGVCETAVEDQCTLRAAVMEANALDSPVTIHLADDATYETDAFGLEDDLGATGDLDITGNVTIDGNGATLTPESGRLFDNFGTLVIDDVTLGGGAATMQQALRNQGGAVITNTAATLSLGAAFDNVSGDLVLVRTNVSGVQQGLQVRAGTVLVADSSIHTTGCLPIACGSSTHDAIVQTGGELTVSNSTIAQGRRTIAWYCGPLVPCLVPIEGNGLVQTGGSATLVRATVANNRTGIVGADVTLRGSVVADNTVADCSGTITSLGYNHDEDGTCLTAPTTGDQTADPAGVATTVTDHTVPPVAGSALLDRIPIGTPDLCDEAHPVDQRGAPRPSGAACDVGAVERQPSDP